MKFFCIVLASIIFTACQSSNQKPINLKSQMDSVSYSIGLDIGKNIKRQDINLDIDILAQGIKDALSGEKQLLTDEQAEQVMISFQDVMRHKHIENQAKLAEKNKIEGMEFLAQNKNKEGVITTKSGLQYKVITAGNGPKPKATQTVTVHYRGTLLDGTEFDNSYNRGTPAVFEVSGVIKGWTEALQLMQVGSKWQLFIPPDLAYGERGAGSAIPPNSTLIFEVELLSVD